MPKQWVGADLSLAADRWAVKGEWGAPLQVLGTLRAAMESQRTSWRIHMGASVRLLKEGGLAGVLSPWNTLVHKTHIPTHRELVVWVLGAPLSSVSCPHITPSGLYSRGRKLSSSV